MTLWQRWLTRPQDVLLRKALFQIHLWTGIGIGLYILMISVTVSILVFRRELFIRSEDGRIGGDASFIPFLLDLHDNLLAGETGRTVNGIAAIMLLLLAITGAVIWWPGVRTWRRSLFVETQASWKRLTWNLHSVLGIWFLLFVLMWGTTGLYLSFPGAFLVVADYLQPVDYASAEYTERLSDRILYWLAYGHFGRFIRRIPGCDVGCDLTLKIVWAGAALVPPVMFVTGAIMWWNRVLRRGKQKP